jgi:uncharacterized protein (DUF2267 family)
MRDAAPSLAMMTNEATQPEGELARWISEVGSRASLADGGAARHVLDAVFETLGEVLLADELAPIVKRVPVELGAAIRRGADRGLAPGNVDDLVAGVEWREHTSEAVAREHVTAVCEILAGRMDRDARDRLHADLPAGLRELLSLRETSGHVHRDPPARADAPPPRDTLATGNPRSRRPVSEARLETAHSQSIARSDNPHEETKLASARGTTQERLGESLAEGAPGPRRPVSED